MTQSLLNQRTFSSQGQGIVRPEDGSSLMQRYCYKSHEIDKHYWTINNWIKLLQYTTTL